MQIEILKRDKIDYVFQSLSIISIVPVLGLEPLKNWSIGNFSFTQAFYNGKPGMLIQILVILLTVICYVLLRKVKNNGAMDRQTVNQENPWQAKVYKNKLGKKIVDLFIPKKGTKEYLKTQKLLKDSAYKLKMEYRPHSHGLCTRAAVPLSHDAFRFGKSSGQRRHHCRTGKNGQETRRRRGTSQGTAGIRRKNPPPRRPDDSHRP